MVTGLCTLMLIDGALAALGQMRLAALLGIIVLAQAVAMAGCFAMGLDPLSL
jgi:hypothetical protein